MGERIVFPDMENALADFLTTELGALSDTAEVVVDIPDPIPARVVRVQRNDRKKRVDREDREGIRGPNLILDRPRMVLDCYDTGGASAQLAATVRAILAAASPGYVGGVWCDCIDDVGIENSTEPEDSSPRHTIVADFYVRGSVLA
ncbi:hypothetical protein OG225_07425 [Nocardia sp. NBC_01377]|uniref:hypothetical protein n=1 Tax=Nocardia TaxID=1817 RepID=UPI001C2221B7|nr:hypothetical protein [Nocardia noduli]